MKTKSENEKQSKFLSPERFSGVFGETELVGHGHLLNGELGVVGERIGQRFDGTFPGNKHELIDVEEEHPLGIEFVPVQAIVHNKELVVVIAVESFLVSDVVKGHVALLDPRPQHLHHRRVDPTRVVDHEMRPLAEEPHMVG